MNWERRPRKGERSREGVRSDQEHAIRKEYGDAGELRGLVAAWAAVTKIADQWHDDGESETADAALMCAEAIAALALSRFPKRASIDLGDAGASVEYVEAMRRKVGGDAPR